MDKRCQGGWWCAGQDEVVQAWTEVSPLVRRVVPGNVQQHQTGEQVFVSHHRLACGLCAALASCLFVIRHPVEQPPSAPVRCSCVGVPDGCTGRQLIGSQLQYLTCFQDGRSEGARACVCVGVMHKVFLAKIRWTSHPASLLPLYTRRSLPLPCPSRPVSPCCGVCLCSPHACCSRRRCGQPPHTTGSERAGRTTSWGLGSGMEGELD